MLPVALGANGNEYRENSISIFVHWEDRLVGKGLSRMGPRAPQPLLLIPGGIARAPSNPQYSGHGFSSVSSLKNSLESLSFSNTDSRFKILGEYIWLDREVGSDSHRDTYAGEISRHKKEIQILSLYFALTHIFGSR